MRARSDRLLKGGSPVRLTTNAARKRKLLNIKQGWPAEQGHPYAVPGRDSANAAWPFMAPEVRVRLRRSGGLSGRNIERIVSGIFVSIYVRREPRLPSSCGHRQDWMDPFTLSTCLQQKWAEILPSILEVVRYCGSADEGRGLRRLKNSILDMLFEPAWQQLWGLCSRYANTKICPKAAFFSRDLVIDVENPTLDQISILGNSLWMEDCEIHETCNRFFFNISGLLKNLLLLGTAGYPNMNQREFKLQIQMLRHLIFFADVLSHNAAGWTGGVDSDNARKHVEGLAKSIRESITRTRAKVEQQGATTMWPVIPQKIGRVNTTSTIAPDLDSELESHHSPVVRDPQETRENRVPESIKSQSRRYHALIDESLFCRAMQLPYEYDNFVTMVTLDRTVDAPHKKVASRAPATYRCLNDLRRDAIITSLELYNQLGSKSSQSDYTMHLAWTFFDIIIVDMDQPTAGKLPGYLDHRRRVSLHRHVAAGMIVCLQQALRYEYPLTDKIHISSRGLTTDLLLKGIGDGGETAGWTDEEEESLTARWTKTLHCRLVQQGMPSFPFEFIDTLLTFGEWPPSFSESVRTAALILLGKITSHAIPVLSRGEPLPYDSLASELNIRIASATVILAVKGINAVTPISDRWEIWPERLVELTSLDVKALRPLVNDVLIPIASRDVGDRFLNGLSDRYAVRSEVAWKFSSQPNLSCNLRI